MKYYFLQSSRNNPDLDHYRHYELMKKCYVFLKDNEALIKDNNLLSTQELEKFQEEKPLIELYISGSLSEID